MANLELRKDQLDAMASCCQKDFEQRLLQHLRKAFPGETREMSDSLLLERAQPSVKKAGKYGIEMEYDVVRLVGLTLFTWSGLPARCRSKTLRTNERTS